MLTRLSRTVMGRKAAMVPTKAPVTMVDFQGVRNLSCTAPKKLGGSMPSRAMASRTRGWLSIMTSSTEVIPAAPARAMMSLAQPSPTCAKAVATGALMSSLS